MRARPETPLQGRKPRSVLLTGGSWLCSTRIKGGWASRLRECTARFFGQPNNYRHLNGTLVPKSGSRFGIRLLTRLRRRHHPNRANRDVPQPGAREQSSCWGVRADAVSITSAAPPSMSLVLSCFAQFHV